MPQEIEVCDHIDFSPVIPDNPQPPICKLEHGWSSACMMHNACPDYKHSIVKSWEEIKAELNLSRKGDASDNPTLQDRITTL